MLNNVLVGNQIARLRKQNGYTQEELAEKLNISAQAISKWENGHTLPETIQLPLLSKLLNISIDSILKPFAVQDSAYLDFANSLGDKKTGLAMQLYQKFKEKFGFDFTINFDDKYNVWDTIYNGKSAMFNIPEKKDYVIRLDLETDASGKNSYLAVRVPLPNCEKYMHIINNMPEYVKKNFRINDCKCCMNDCPYVMAYTFENVAYRQCHFITIGINSAENIEHLLTLICAEHDK